MRTRNKQIAFEEVTLLYYEYPPKNGTLLRALRQHSSFHTASVVSGPLVIRHADKGARSLRPTSLLRNGGSSYSEEPEVEILEHGEARLRNVAVPGRYVDHLEM